MSRFFYRYLELKIRRGGNMKLCSFVPMMMAICHKGKVLGMIYNIPPGEYEMDESERPFIPKDNKDKIGTQVPWVVLSDSVKENGLKGFLGGKINELFPNGESPPLAEMNIGMPRGHITGPNQRIVED